MESKRFTLNQTDIEKWLRNTAVYSAPFALVFLIAVQQGKTLKEALYVVYLYALNVMIDLLRKFIDGRK